MRALTAPGALAWMVRTAVRAKNGLARGPIAIRLRAVAGSFLRLARAGPRHAFFGSSGALGVSRAEITLHAARALLQAHSERGHGQATGIYFRASVYATGSLEGPPTWCRTEPLGTTTSRPGLELEVTPQAFCRHRLPHHGSVHLDPCLPVQHCEAPSCGQNDCTGGRSSVAGRERC